MLRLAAVCSLRQDGEHLDPDWGMDWLDDIGDGGNQRERRREVDQVIKASCQQPS